MASSILLRTAVLAFLATGAAHAFEIKGYVLGAPMAECPAGVARSVPKGNEITCYMPATTIAGVRADPVLTLYEGKLARVFFFLGAKGQYANTGLRDALIEKFGPPTSERRHLNTYQWLRDGAHLSLEGWDGVLASYEVDAIKRLQQERARARTSDL